MRKIPLFIPLMSLMMFCGCAGFAPDIAAATATFSATDIKATETIAEATRMPASSAPEGWLMYDNEVYGYYFHYPPQYQVLTDETNLYGWKNGVVLLYNGGQSYDIAVQVWETAEEMATVYGGEDERLHVYPTGTQIISVMNITNEAENDGIIGSFTIY
jgi:hypothetical protein